MYDHMYHIAHILLTAIVPHVSIRYRPKIFDNFEVENSIKFLPIFWAIF